MSTVEDFIAALDSFKPTQGLKSVHQLRKSFADFRSLAGRERAIPSMFSLLRRFPEVDFGAPPFLVHEIEAIPGYEPLLIQSLEEQPFRDNVGMIARILHSDLSPEQRTFYLGLLKAAARHPGANPSARELAEEHLVIQANNA